MNPSTMKCSSNKDGDIDLVRTDFEKIPEYLDSYTEVVYAIKYSSGKLAFVSAKSFQTEEYF